MKDKSELSDTQLLILNAASTNMGRSILPHSKGMRAFGLSLTRAISQLVEKGFIVRGNVAYNEMSLKDEKGVHTYRITPAGLKAIGIEEEQEVGDDQHEKKQKKMKEGDHIEKAVEATAKKPRRSAEERAELAELKEAKRAEREAARAASKEEKETAKAAAAALKEAQKAEREAAKANGEKTPALRAPSQKGKCIFPTKETNPCRAGASRELSFAIILEKPGLSYDEYIAAGGSTFDLRFFAIKGYIESKFASVADAD